MIAHPIKTPITLVVPRTGEAPTGLSTYAGCLLDEYKKAGLSVSVIEPEKPGRFITLLSTITGINFTSVFEQFPYYLALPKEGVIHLTHQGLALPLLYLRRKGTRKVVVTVHDLIPLARSADYGFLERCLWKLLSHALRKSSHIIAISEHTKKDVVRYLGYPEEKVTVILSGVNQAVFKPSTSTSNTSTSNNESTILVVGSEMPRKNIQVVIKALALLTKKISDIKLVKVGASQWPHAREELKKLAAQLGVLDKITFHEYVKNLSEVYQQASVFVMPSLYEGFGLPVLEAMACGCPIICSDRTSLPELGGDAVLYFNPEDAQELADKIHTVLTDQKTKEKLKKYGLQRVQQFTWKKTMQKVIVVYQQK